MLHFFFFQNLFSFAVWFVSYFSFLYQSIIRNFLNHLLQSSGPIGCNCSKNVRTKIHFKIPFFLLSVSLSLPHPIFVYISLNIDFHNCFFHFTLNRKFELFENFYTGGPRYSRALDFLSANSRFAVQNGGPYLPKVTRETCIYLLQQELLLLVASVLWQVVVVVEATAYQLLLLVGPISTFSNLPRSQNLKSN